jgi:hypothetical protein
MPCYSCSSDFGFLKREIGCEICGFAFCQRCCKKRDENKKNVCNKCFNNLASNVKLENTSPPLAHKRRMAALKKSSYSMDSDPDKEIYERLQKLKKDRKKDSLPSEENIAERLAKLKGIEPSKYKAPPIEVYRPPTTAEDLMKQLKLECELESRIKSPEEEIEERLAALKDEVPKVKGPPKESPEVLSVEVKGRSEEMDIDEANIALQKEHYSISQAASRDVSNLMSDPDYKSVMMTIVKEKDVNAGSDEEDEEAANRLVEKLLATHVESEELESLDDTEESNSKSEKETTEEFPWCVICTEDAKIRCFDCDSDVYCLRCFRECHDSLEIKDHKTCPYLPEKDSAM